MKVYIITGEPFPNGMAAVSRIKNYARAIREGGIEVEVLIYRRTEVYGRVNNIETSGVYEGVPYRYIPNTTQRGRFRFLRFFYDQYDLQSTVKYLNRNIKRGDVLLLYMSGNVQYMLKFIKVAYIKGAFSIRDLCELPYGTGLETEKSIRLRKTTIERQFPCLDGIISISDTLLNLARTYTQPSCKHIKVPIMVDYNQFYLPDRSAEIPVPYIFHAGTLYQQKDGILGMIEAFGKAIQRLPVPVKFISTGYLENSPHAEEIKRLVAQYHLEGRLQLIGYIGNEKLKDYLSKASCVIINKYHTQQNIYCFSTKLGEYLAASKPVIITSVGEAMNWLENGKSAYIVEPEDVNALADTIVQVFINPNESRKIGSAGQEVCRKCFDYRNWSNPIVEFLNQLGK